MTSPNPGWYPANVPGHERWWDGRQWTDTLRPTGAAEPPPVAQAAISVAGRPSSRRKILIGLGAAIALVALIAAIGALTKKPSQRTAFSSLTTPSVQTSATDDPTTDSAPPSSAPAPLPVLAAGGSADLVESDGSTVIVSIGKPLGTANQNGLWTGFPVTLSGPALDSSMFDPTNLTYGPVNDPSSSNVADGSGTGLAGQDPITPIACKGVQPLADVLDAATGSKAVGCVVFSYAATDHPSVLTYYPNGPDDTSVAAIVWKIGPPAKSAIPPTGIVYTVTSDEGINSVTYSTSGFQQAQDTEVSGNTWSKKIPDDGVDYASVLAQNGGGGTITCTITIDGKQVAKQSSHGQYAIVTCSASP